MNVIKWHTRFMELAQHVSTWSKDPSTKVGSVITDECHRVLAVGYNGFPRGVEDTAERWNNRATKLDFVAHAERNALDNATLRVTGCTLYATLFPCSECAKSIIQNGISRVITKALTDRPISKYEITLQMFKEAGIEVIYI